MLDDTYAAAWRGLPREDRRAKVAEMHAELRSLSLQALIDDIHVTSFCQGVDGCGPRPIYAAHENALRIRLAKSEILRRYRAHDIDVLNRRGGAFTGDLELDDSDTFHRVNEC